MKSKSLIIKDKQKVDEIVRTLDIEKWIVILLCRYKLASMMHIKLNEDVCLDLYGIDEGYVKIKFKNKSKYYKTPKNIYNNVIKLVN